MIVPDKIAPELGWRVWRVTDKTGQLSPVHISAPAWKPGQPLMARCHANRPEPRAWIPTSAEEAFDGEYMTHVDWFRQKDKRGVARPPRTRLPRGMFYTWQAIEDTHHAPA